MLDSTESGETKIFRRRVVGGSWDGRDIETPFGQAVIRLPDLTKLPSMTDVSPAGVPILADSHADEYHVCSLQFPGARVEVWHLAGTSVVETVARLADGYVPAKDIRAVMNRIKEIEARNVMLQSEIEKLVLRKDADKLGE